jgi:hypothetical protein
MIKINKFRYEIDELNAVRIWNDENLNEDNAPFFYQPNKPDGTPWVDKAEVETWTVDLINGLLNPPLVESVEE